MELLARASRRSLLLALAGGLPARAADAPLYILLDGSIETPQALFKDGKPVDGLQYLLALELRQRLGRRVRFR